MATQPFGEHLKEAREAARLSQFDLARLTGVPQRQISAIESGSRDPSWKEAVAFDRGMRWDHHYSEGESGIAGCDETGR